MDMEIDELDTRTVELQESAKMLKNKRRTDTDKDINGDENISDSPWKSIPFTSETPSKTARWENTSNLLKRPVVVLTRLPDYKISALRPPTPQQFYSEDESLSSSDSDMPWEPDDSSDSDCPVPNNKQKNVKPAPKLPARTPASPSTSNNSNATPHCSQDTTRTRPNLAAEEVKVDMMVLARKRATRWQRGKLVEMVTKEDGRIKYKVSFEGKGRSLLSGHHIAFDNTPKLDQLYVGARVVVQCQDNKFRFWSGILAELPSRKNRLRFLVFMDDHTPFYVGLPSLHLVCKPLENVLDNIPDGPHKCFMKKYLKDWPYPHFTHCKPGDHLTAELNGVQQRCEVQVVDCSLIQVVFEANQHREWIHRGSIRLERMLQFLDLKEEDEATDDSDE